MKHLLKLKDYNKKQILDIINLAIKLKEEKKNGVMKKYLEGKTLGMIFTKSSTRTRVSFEVGIHELGGTGLFLSSNDIQIGRGESIHDTAKVLSRYLDGIMIRTFKQSDVEGLAKHGSIPIINGLTDLTHPCQILADFMTIQEEKGKLEGLKLAYIGDGNNIANSLLYGCSIVGMDIAIATPKDYACKTDIVDEAKEFAKKSNANVLITTDPKKAMENADVVYTDTWVSMGQENEKEEKTKIFKPYQVNKELTSYAKDDYIFLHCLPAYRGFEVTSEIIDGNSSKVFDEAENRLHAQKAVMVKLMK